MQNDQETVQFIVPPARPENLAPGMFLGKDKNYHLEKFLGAGGMGHVWLATEIEDGVELRKVVCKILPALVQREKKEMDKVLKTFHLVQPLNHPNICPIYSLRADPGCGYFFVIGYADGGTLEDWLKRQPDYANGLAVSKVVEILRPIAQALDYAHEMGIMHRDVKPQNILFVTRGERKIPWLIDFGISAQIHSTMTQTLGERGSSGTPAYMAPEQCQSRLQDGRTDQYALGVLAYQLLSGRLPFVADNPLALYNQIVYNPVPPLANISAQANVAVQRALAKDRKDRFDSCVEFLEALVGEKISSPSLRKAPRPFAKTQKKFPWALLACFLALVVIGLGIYCISVKRTETVGPTLPLTSNDLPAVAEPEESENVVPLSTVPESKEIENVVSEEVIQKPSVTGSNVPVSDEADFVMSVSTLMKYRGSEKDVVIPAVINGQKVKYIGNSAFRDCNTITSVVIPEGITEIGDWSFPSCHSLKSVVIPKSVKTIKEGAFVACAFTSVEIPEGVTEIGDQAFLNCHSLTSVTLPDSLEKIGGGAFSECTALKEWSVSPNQPYFKTDGTGLLTKDGKKLVACLPSAKEYRIPDGVTEIGAEAFSYSSISSVVIPQSVTKIGERAFELSHSLTSIVLPEGLKEIGTGAFACCSSLVSVVIPDSVEEIGGGAFRLCKALKEWTISPNHPFFKKDGNGLLTKDGKKLVACLTSAEEYHIPESVTEIESCAFADCSLLPSAEIPEGVTVIGDHAFMRCTSLTSVEIPEGVMKIEKCTFMGCNSLTSLTIPGSVTEIGIQAFEGCPQLTIHAPKGSKAEEYAKEKGIPFEAE